MISDMSYFSENLTNHLNSSGWGEYGLVKAFAVLPKEQTLSEQYVYSLCRGERSPKLQTLQKLAEVPGLGVDLATLKAWRAIDEYGQEAIDIAYELSRKGGKLTKAKKIELVEKAIKDSELS